MSGVQHFCQVTLAVLGVLALAASMLLVVAAMVAELGWRFTLAVWGTVLIFVVLVAGAVGDLG